jgi:co-chaperonin GroES (HSP10)
MKALGNRVLVAHKEETDGDFKKQGSLFLVGKTTSNVEAVVLAVGPDVKGVEPGETVVLTGHGGYELTIDGRKVYSFNANEILAVL